MQNPTYYGMDVSKDDIHIAWQDQHQHWQQETIKNELLIIEQWVQKHLPTGQTQVILEHTGTYSNRLTVCLALNQCPFSLITPHQSKSFAGVVKTITKTDAQDARRLALYGQRMQPGASALAEECLHQTRQLHQHLATLRTDFQAVANRLHALSYDPRASQKVVQSLQEVQSGLAAQIALFEDDLDQSGGAVLVEVARQMQTVTGIGPKTSSALAVATDGLVGFESARAVAKFIGVAPSVAESGSSVRYRGRMCRRGQGGLRGLLYMAARAARLHNRVCKGLYDRLRAKGRCHRVAMVAVMNKLIHQVFAVVKSGLAFDNNYGLAIENLA